jgi:hypothetical protein
LAISSASENGFSTSITSASSLPWEARTGCAYPDSKACSMTLAAMPVPLSLTRSRTFLPRRAFEPTAMVSASTVMLPVSIISVPPPGIASRAFTDPSA